MMTHEKLFACIFTRVSLSLGSNITCKTLCEAHSLYLFSLFSCLAREQQQEQDPTNLYISNLPLSVDEKELDNMLQPFGQVVSTRILRDYSGNSRGVGFARSVAKD